MTRKADNNNANDSTIHEDDPRITAYALGELSDEDAASLESELSANPEWQETIASVQETAGLLRQALEEEPMVGLTQAHREEIESRIADSGGIEAADSPATPLTTGQKVAGLGAGIAASLFFLFSVAIPVLTEQYRMPRPTARGSEGFESRHPENSVLKNLIDIVQSGPSEELIDDTRDGIAEENKVESHDDSVDSRETAMKRMAALGYTGSQPNIQPKPSAHQRPATNQSSLVKIGAGNFIVTDGSMPTIDINNVEELYARALENGIEIDTADYNGLMAVAHNEGVNELDLDDLQDLIEIHTIGGDGNDDFNLAFADDLLDTGGPERIQIMGCGGESIIDDIVDAEWSPVEFDASDFADSSVLVNSENRGRVSEEGRYVLFNDGHASFHENPLVGIDNENIFRLMGAQFAGFDNLAKDHLLFTGNAENRIQAGWWQFVDADGDGVPDAFAPQESTTERYAHIRENPFKSVAREPLSTFSIDVDTASYANVRRMLTSGQLPPRDAVRIEEFINYFAYDYPQPSIDEPFSINVDVADCPWNLNHRLARIGLQGYEIPNDERPESNLVFLIDVSGSMNQPNKLPLLKQSMTLLVDQLDEYDRVAIVVYAGASGLVLDSISCDNRGTILDAINNLQPGGGTNGTAGIELAYSIAADNFIEGGTNRVILATDGDFNVGVTSKDDLHRLIEEKAKTGVFLSVLGFGGGNYQDATLELLADKGNGNYAYIDTLREAEKVLVEQMGGTLVTIAKDVKIQVEFNPAMAAGYRLIGYENRMLAKEDFNDDTKDAGEIGAGHTVTALYEIVPAGEEPLGSDVDPLKYQVTPPSPILINNDELMTVKVRYKLPDEDKSTKLEHPVLDEGATLEQASDDFRFAAAVASFGMILRNSTHRGDAAFDQVFNLAENGSGEARSEDRNGFLELVERAEALMQQAPSKNDDETTE